MFETLVKIGLPIALIMIMAGVGLSLTINDFRRVFRQPRGFLVGAVAQMVFLPLVAVIIIAAFGLHGELAIGLFLLSLCPGGTTSNLYTYLARGDVGLSVSLTAVIGFITPFTIPVLGAWAISYYSDNDKVFELPLLKTWLQLIVITVIPVIAGMLIRARWQAFAKRVEPAISWFSMAVLAAVILSIAVNLGEKLIDFTIASGPAALTLNLLTMLLGYGLGKWLLHNEAQARTICLEVGLQNGTLTLLITTSILQSAEMSIAPSVYSLIMFITATLFTFRAGRKPQLA
ncbi:bile acid:sodium symporter family protein [Bacterioplanoides pacificum]|uniref:Bile acid:sodium symporter family protein n=1 Tax=Bacterioplanoides pacificum TaxID=1171596 RepID=A0ABV7VNZ8_9GAMM